MDCQFQKRNRFDLASKVDTSEGSCSFTFDSFLRTTLWLKIPCPNLSYIGTLPIHPIYRHSTCHYRCKRSPTYFTLFGEANCAPAPSTQLTLSRTLSVALQLYAYFGFWRADVCKQFFVFIPAFPIFGVTASHIILLIQCHAVWNREGLVLIALIPLMVSETVIMAVIAFTQNEREY